jgi:hypothetical protein
MSADVRRCPHLFYPGVNDCLLEVQKMPAPECFTRERAFVSPSLDGLFANANLGRNALLILECTIFHEANLS